MLLIYVADALWILALSIMSGASREAGKRVPKGVGLPMPFGPDRKPTWRAPRGLALAFTPVLATVIGLAMLVAARGAVERSGDEQLIWFGVRAFTASLFALLHLAWLRAAMKTLMAEGALKP